MSDAVGKLLWPNWVEVIKNEAKQKGAVSFIGYGSLINSESAKKTLTKLGELETVVAFGAKRIFNFSLADSDYKENGGRNERSSNEKHSACLNALPTNNDYDEFVGVLINLKPDQVDAFAEREYGYDISLISYQTLDGERHKAYILVASNKGDGSGHTVQDNILPNETYLQTCLQGAINHGDEFLTSWLDSCYLADGKTKLQESEYYQEFLASHLDEFLQSLSLDKQDEKNFRKILTS